MSEFRILDYNYAFDPSVSITATTEDASFPASNLAQYFRSRVWRSSSIASTQRIVFDLKTAAEIDSFAILFNPIQGEGVKLSDTATLTLKANATDSWDTPALSVSLSVDNTFEVVTHFFSAPETYRYWALEITDIANAYGYIEIAKVILAKATQLSQAPEIGFTDEQADQSKVVETPYGHRYADLYPNRRTLSFNYVAMTDTDIQTLQQVYARVGTVTPIAVALDPTATLFDKDRFFLYGYLANKLSSANKFYSYFDAGLKLTEGM